MNAMTHEIHVQAGKLLIRKEESTLVAVVQQEEQSLKKRVVRLYKDWDFILTEAFELCMTL